MVKTENQGQSQEHYKSYSPGKEEVPEEGEESSGVPGDSLQGRKREQWEGKPWLGVELRQGLRDHGVTTQRPGRGRQLG